MQQPIDLTDSIKDIKGKSPDEVAQEVETYINVLIGQVIDTATKPLQVQITAGNKAHVVRSNVNLKGSKKERHNAALLYLEKLINNAVKTERDGTVDLTHNTKRKTLRHKRTVLKYVYFETPIKIEDTTYFIEFATEQIKGQDPNLLNLYNVKVKETSAAAPFNAPQSRGSKNNISQENANVNTIFEQLPLSETDINVNRKNENILSQQGGATFNGLFDTDLKAVVIGSNFNEGTLPHEIAHFWLDKLFSIYKTGNVTETFNYKIRGFLYSDIISFKNHFYFNLLI